MNRNAYAGGGALDRRAFVGLSLGALATPLAGCQYNPELGRSQLMLVSDDQMAALGDQAWKEIRSTSRRADDRAQRRRLETIGTRIADASGETHRNWEFEVFEGPANAFALPGGKVGFFTGIFPYASNDAQIANVMGHEAGHIHARHGAERLSQQIGVSLTTGALAAMLAGTSTDSRSSQALVGVLGAGMTFGILLPYSRRHEFEADNLGVRYMAQAGYDPRESPRFWENMTRASRQRGKPPEFLSTHPSDEARIAEINGLMPNALGIYQRAPRAPNSAG